MGECKDETPLQLLSYAVDCLTKIAEDEAVEPDTRKACEALRDLAVGVLMVMQIQPEAAA